MQDVISVTDRLPPNVRFKELLKESKLATKINQSDWIHLQSFLINQTQLRHVLPLLTVKAERGPNEEAIKEIRLRLLLRELVNFGPCNEKGEIRKLRPKITRYNDSWNPILNALPDVAFDGRIALKSKTRAYREYFLLELPFGVSRKDAKKILARLLSELLPEKKPQKKRSMSSVLLNALLCAAHEEKILPKVEADIRSVPIIRGRVPRIIGGPHVQNARDYITNLARDLAGNADLWQAEITQSATPSRNP